MSATTPSFGPGGLTVTLDLGPSEGAVRARRVTIASSRPTGFSATLFAGRHGDDVPGLVGRLHALCGRSHAVAAEAAIAAAAGGTRAASATAVAPAGLYARAWCHADSTSSVRTWPLPVRVIAPRDTVSPLELSDGTRPR